MWQIYLLLSECISINSAKARMNSHEVAVNAPRIEQEEMRMSDMTLAPGDIPDFVKEAEAAMANGEQIIEERKEVTIKFAKGLVGEPFMSKNGKELVEVKIPNADQNDKTPWASFVISPKMVHDNKFSKTGKGVWMKLPEDGTTVVKKPICIGTNPEGKRIWHNDMKTVTNTELKEMVEVYKTRNQDYRPKPQEQDKADGGFVPAGGDSPFIDVDTPFTPPKGGDSPFVPATPEDGNPFIEAEQADKKPAKTDAVKDSQESDNKTEKKSLMKDLDKKKAEAAKQPKKAKGNPKTTELSK